MKFQNLAHFIPILSLWIISLLNVACSKENSPKDFVELTKQPYFIDHTTLLSHFCKPPLSSISFLSCPRGFGKTTNLQMMHLFNDFELDSNHKPKPINETTAYKIFSKTIISQDPSFPWNSNRYDSFDYWVHDEGRRPVISIDLETTETLGDFTDEKIIAFFNEKLYQAFDKYKWILDLSAETLHNINLLNLHQKIYNAYLKNHRILETPREYNRLFPNIAIFEMNERLHHAYVNQERISDVPAETLFEIDAVKPYIILDEHIELIKKLAQKQLTSKFEIAEAFYRFAQFLQAYFQSGVLILIDDYDSAFVKSSKPNKQQIELYYQFVNDIIKHVVQAPPTKTILHILITSTTGILYPLNDTDAENSYKISCLDDKEIRNYYGFSETDVADLSKRYKLTTEQVKELKQNYGGYTLPNFTASYNPSSVIQYLKNLEIEKDKALKSYWNESKNDNYLRGFRDDQVFRKTVQDIVNDGTTENGIVGEYNISDTKRFFDLNDENQYKKTDYNTLFKYVYEQGYVTNVIEKGTASVKYKAVNVETKKALKTLILD